MPLYYGSFCSMYENELVVVSFVPNTNWQKFICGVFAYLIEEAQVIVKIDSSKEIRSLIIGYLTNPDTEYLKEHGPIHPDDINDLDVLCDISYELNMYPDFVELMAKHLSETILDIKKANKFIKKNNNSYYGEKWLITLEEVLL